MVPCSDVDSLINRLPVYILHAILSLIQHVFRSLLRTTYMLTLIKSFFSRERKSELSDSFETNQTCLEQMKESETIAFDAEGANRYYETPVDFFIPALGPYLKYSACLFEKESDSLSQAEINMMRLYCKKVGLENGMRVLDAGCGWGSLAIFICQNYPLCEVFALTLSKEASDYILQRAYDLGITNLTVERQDLTKTHYSHNKTFDRIFLIEVVEFMRNVPGFFQLASTWLKPSGQMLVHSFCSKKHHPVFMEISPNSPLYKRVPSWISFYMFSGATLFGIDTLLYFQDHVKIISYNYLKGTHYSQTIDKWRKNMSSPSPNVSKAWWFWWHVFALVTAELFRFRDGQSMGIIIATYEARS